MPSLSHPYLCCLFFKGGNIVFKGKVSVGACTAEVSCGKRSELLLWCSTNEVIIKKTFGQGYEVFLHSCTSHGKNEHLEGPQLVHEDG